jgi:hypothetical protein
MTLSRMTLLGHVEIRSKSCRYTRGSTGARTSGARARSGAPRSTPIVGCWISFTSTPFVGPVGRPRTRGTSLEAIASETITLKPAETARAQREFSRGPSRSKPGSRLNAAAAGSPDRSRAQPQSCWCGGSRVFDRDSSTLLRGDFAQSAAGLMPNGDQRIVSSRATEEPPREGRPPSPVIRAREGRRHADQAHDPARRLAGR